jgi:hypothetical protein
LDYYIWHGNIAVDFDDILVTPERYISDGIDYLWDTIKDYHGNIPRWYNQPHYVEVWLEKNAIAGSFNSILNNADNPRRVVIAPNGGWSSTTFAADNLHRLLRKKKQGKIVHLQYYGDSDPSGERMDESTEYKGKHSKLINVLREIHGFDFQRIAITDQTIDDFDLHHLKEITAANVKPRNPNIKYFKEKHNGQLWQIEVDALLLDPHKFKELVLFNVDKWFDEKIHKEAVEEVKNELYPDSEIHILLKQKIQELFSFRALIYCMTLCAYKSDSKACLINKVVFTNQSIR